MTKLKSLAKNDFYFSSSRRPLLLRRYVHFPSPWLDTASLYLTNPTVCKVWLTRLLRFRFSLTTRLACRQSGSFGPSPDSLLDGPHYRLCKHRPGQDCVLEDHPRAGGGVFRLCHYHRNQRRSLHHCHDPAERQNTQCTLCVLAKAGDWFL